MNKISYALGLGIAQQLKSMGIEDFSVEDFSQSVSDILSGKTPAMTSREAQELLSEYFQKKQKEQERKNRKWERKQNSFWYNASKETKAAILSIFFLVFIIKINTNY